MISTNGLKCPWNANSLLSSGWPLILEGWYKRLVSVTWVLGTTMTVSLSSVSENGTWPHTWLSGSLGASGMIRFSLKPQVVSVITSRGVLPNKHTVESSSFLYWVTTRKLRGLDMLSSFDLVSGDCRCCDPAWEWWAGSLFCKTVSRIKRENLC